MWFDGSAASVRHRSTAHRLEKALGTPAHIYYKYEGTSPAGSHKPNTAVPQAYYNAKAGVKKLTTETGAGQWGTALAFACAQFALECEVWQVRASYDAKPYRRLMMEVFGATVHPSPSTLTNSGRAILAASTGSPGSLGIAISEAVEVAAPDPATRYALGSVLNHVLMHQTVIGLEALKQFEMAGESESEPERSIEWCQTASGVRPPVVSDRQWVRPPVGHSRGR